jgi:hypothetical protein
MFLTSKLKIFIVNASAYICIDFVLCSELQAANTSPSLPSKTSRNGFNFHHPFPDLMNSTSRQIPLPSLFAQEIALEQKKATVMLRKPSISDEKFRKHSLPTSSNSPNDSKKRKLQDDKAELEQSQSDLPEQRLESNSVKETKSPSTPLVMDLEQAVNSPALSPKEIKSSPVTPKPILELQHPTAESTPIDHPSVYMPKSEEEKISIPSPKPTAKPMSNTSPLTPKKEPSDAVDVRWEAKLQQFFKDRAQALDGWLDRAILRRVHESFDKNALLASLEKDVKSSLSNRNEDIVDTVGKELDNAVRSRCRKTLGLDSNADDLATGDPGRVDDAAGRFVHEVWNAQLKAKEDELSDSVSNLVSQIFDKHMDKFAQRLIEPMDQTIQTVFTRRLVSMEPKLINLIDSRIAELWKSRMDKMSGLMTSNIDMTIQQMLKERLHKINFEPVSEKQDAFSQNGATPTSQDHIEEIEMIPAASRNATTWH